LVERLPLEWAFKVETPLPDGWRYRGPEGPLASSDERLSVEEPNVANGWRPLRTDLYIQAQGVRGEGGQSHVGHYWYRTAVSLDAGKDRGNVRLMFQVYSMRPGCT
jgi:hypothetical protein